MKPLDRDANATQVCHCLSHAWRFLSGQERDFHYLARNAKPLQFAAFSYFMPLSTLNPPRHGGVGVLLDHEDALAVATHMFGVAEAQVRDADLHDACAEVCNVLSDCVAPQFEPSAPVGPGLPRLASPTQYDHIAATSQARAVFQASRAHHHLFVVLYDRSNGIPASTENA